MHRMLSGSVLSALVLTSAAHAGTLDEVTKHGMVVTLGSFDLGTDFTADNRFSMADGMIRGTWRTDGNKLCLTGDTDGLESCTEYPEGKVSGDTFEVQLEHGPATVRIR